MSFVTTQFSDQGLREVATHLHNVYRQYLSNIDYRKRNYNQNLRNGERRGFTSDPEKGFDHIFSWACVCTVGDQIE